MKLLFTLLSLFLFTVTASAEDITVQAEGIGATKMEALSNAWSEAVRNAVGLYLNSRDVTVDNKVTEQIATYSRGRVNSYTILHEEKSAGGWKLLINANIDKDVLQEAKIVSKKTEIPTDRILDITSKGRQHNDLENVINNFEPWHNLSDFLTYQSQVELAPDKKSLYCIHLITINENYKKIFIPELNKLLV